MSEHHKLSTTELLATADEHGHRIWVYAADVKGKHRTRRTALDVVLLVIFLGLPWLRIGGQQAVLMDILHGKFVFFGFQFWRHEAPTLFFVLAGFILSIVLMTAVWGRVWCGWLCPQTVFVDAIYRRIERFIEGDAGRRRRLDKAPWDTAKIVKKFAKWALFLVVSLVISHSFLAYWVGTHELREMMRASPAAHPFTFFLMVGMSGFVLFDFGWFREQFCTIVCPYGRFQSVLLDDRSQIVTYDAARGEPRRRSEASKTLGRQGDCVDCGKCVRVCPTGIDIRRGLQMECIACTACMDACDDIMRSLKKPEGLIRYTPVKLLRPRVLAMVAVLLVIFSGLAYRMSTRQELVMTMIRAIEAPYQVISPGIVINHFKVDLRSQAFEDRETLIRIVDPPEGASIVLSNHVAVLRAGQSARTDLFVKMPVERFVGRGNALIQIELVSARDNRVISSQEVKLVGPMVAPAASK